MHRAAVGVSIFAVALATLFPAQQTKAQAYPTRAVRMIVPYGSGGSVDLIARMIAQKMTESMGQQVVVDNRPGASGNIGTELAVRAPADGYTILMVTIPLVVNPSFYRNLPFDVLTDLVPVSRVAAAPFILVVHPSLPIKSVRELITLAKKEPGKLNFLSGGKGTNSHVALELFKNLTGVDIVHVPYKGSGAGLIAIVSGEVELGVLGFRVAMSNIKTGKLRALGLTGTKRSPELPGIPTIAEAGVPGYDFTSWYGVLVPAGTPANVIAALHGHIVKAMHAPDLVDRLSKDDTAIIASSPEQFAAFIKSELARWNKVVKGAGLRLNNSRHFREVGRAL